MGDRGSIVGNTVLHQGQLNPPVYRGSKRRLFTTTCLKTLAQYGTPQGVSFQLGPRGGSLQTFDFQYSRDGALFMYWPEFDSIASLLESPPGSDLLHVVDEHRFALTRKAQSLPKSILFSLGKLEEREARDLWWEIYQAVNGGIRAAFGVKETLVTAAGGGGCDLPQYVRDRRVKMKILGEEVDPAEALYRYADRVIPLLPKLGARSAGLFVTDNDVTAFGLECKLDGGIHGELHVASICATHRFFPSEFWGGIKAWRYMADQAHAHGLAVGHWFAPHFSSKAPFLKEHPEYLMTGVETHWYGGGYGHGHRAAIVTADWNTGIYQLVLDDLKRWKEEGGLDFLFTDSWPNMALLPVNYAAGMRTNFRALGRLYADLQKIGVLRHSFEGISPFGISHFGACDMRGDLLEEKQGVAGQNDFGWWVGEEDMAFNIQFLLEPRKRTEAEMHEIIFRCMANRSGMSYAPTTPAPELGKGVCRIKESWDILNRIYEQALPHMKIRRLLSQKLGVRWLDGEVQLMWVYAPCYSSVSCGCRVERLDGSSTTPLRHEGRILFEAGRVYRITGSDLVEVHPAT
ncbi:MAG: hypothetical protein L6437_04220 [Kiritimatiellae bacterium]|nr:hypothetical protein [Kiritimatiellia bacterium]